MDHFIIDGLPILYGDAKHMGLCEHQYQILPLPEDLYLLIPVNALVPYHERILTLRYEATRH